MSTKIRDPQHGKKSLWVALYGAGDNPARPCPRAVLVAALSRDEASEIARTTDDNWTSRYDVLTRGEAAAFVRRIHAALDIESAVRNRRKLHR